MQSKINKPVVVESPFLTKAAPLVKSPFIRATAPLTKSPYVDINAPLVKSPYCHWAPLAKSGFSWGL